MSDCRFGVSPVNYPDPDPDPDLLISKILNHLQFVINITSPLETLYLISINLFLILTFMQTLLSHEIVKIPNLCILQPVI